MQSVYALKKVNVEEMIGSVLSKISSERDTEKVLSLIQKKDHLNKVRKELVSVLQTVDIDF